MGNDSQDSVTALLRSLGGAGNIVSVTNCMTRLRVSVKTESDVSDETLRSVDGVMGVVHDRPCSYEIVVGP